MNVCLCTAGTIPFLYSTKYTIHLFVKSLSASKDVLAMASIEVNLADIQEGQNMVFMWR